MPNSKNSSELPHTFIQEDSSISQKSPEDLVGTLDEEVAKIIGRYSYGAVGTMIAIPTPGVDMVATYMLWGKMIADIAAVYGEKPSFKDAKSLATELFKSVILTTVAWFASAKTASEVLKFVPGAGTVIAYVIDATIAAFGAKKITSALGFAAAAYYKSGKKINATDLLDEVAKVLKDPSNLATLLRGIKS